MTPSPVEIQKFSSYLQLQDYSNDLTTALTLTLSAKKLLTLNLYRAAHVLIFLPNTETPGAK